MESDIVSLAQMNSDKKVMEYFPNTLSQDESIEIVNRINKHFDRNGFGLFAIKLKETSEFIGFTGFSIPSFESHFTPSTEIVWRYKKEVWGNGYASEAAKVCLRYCFETLKFDKVFSFTAVVNKPSEELMKRIGMQYIAGSNISELNRDIFFANMYCTR